MTNVLVPYHSACGHTEATAKAHAEGARFQPRSVAGDQPSASD